MIHIPPLPLPLPSVEMSPPNQKRYAIYFTPPCHSDWWRFGCSWLHRDPMTNTQTPRFSLPGLQQMGINDAYLNTLTSEPFRYGFHATLKAPFRLKKGSYEQDLYRQVQQLSRTLKTTKLTPLSIQSIDGFVALTFPGNDMQSIHEEQMAINRLAAQCVTKLDVFRDDPSLEELEKRRSQGLTPRQIELLEDWGYPFVLQEYRFHMTLTNRVEKHLQNRIIDALEPSIDQLNQHPLFLDALSVFEQSSYDSAFVATRRYCFDGQVEIYNHG